jgi:hypothetical protein
MSAVVRSRNWRRRQEAITHCIIYSASLGDDGVDKGINEALICDVTSCGQDNNIAVDLRELFPRPLELVPIDVRNGNAFAAAIDERLRDRCSYA